MIDMTAMKLGKLPKKADRLNRTLQLKAMLTPEARTMAVPNGLDLACGKRTFTMKLNDQLGTCGPVAIANMLEMVTFLATQQRITISDSAVLEAYEAVGGYIPGKPDTDNGVHLLDLLNHMRKTGIKGPDGQYHKIMAFLEVDPQNDLLSKYVDTVFEGSLFGFALPRTAMTQTVWDFVKNTGDGAPWSWGGHAVCQARWGMDGMGTHREAVTWSHLKPYTPAFAHHYCDERYVILFEDMFNEQGKTFTGLDLNMVWSELTKVTS